MWAEVNGWRADAAENKCCAKTVGNFLAGSHSSLSVMVLASSRGEPKNLRGHWCCVISPQNVYLILLSGS